MYIDIIDKFAKVRRDDYPLADEAIKEIEHLRARVEGLLESNNRLVEERRAAQANVTLLVQALGHVVTLPKPVDDLRKTLEYDATRQVLDGAFEHLPLQDAVAHRLVELHAGLKPSDRERAR
jgi:hypothetical protein